MAPRPVDPSKYKLHVVSFSVVLAHNHPSGDPKPSNEDEDLRLTRQLVEAGNLLDIRVHDHVIIGNGTDAYVSLRLGGTYEKRH